MEKNIYVTPWGSEVIGFSREGKNDANTLASILRHDEYNLKGILDSGARLNFAIDIGAHIGGFTMACRSLGMKVVSVECLPENVELQMKSLIENRWTDTTVLHAAISNTNGEKMTVSYCDTSNPNGDHHEFVGGSVTHAGGRTTTVDTVNLPFIFDYYLDDPILTGIIVKTDCEGGEWLAFKDLPDNVLDRIDWIVGEVHPTPDSPGKGSKADLLGMLKGKFEDVSGQFKTFNGADDLCTFVFKRK